MSLILHLYNEPSFVVTTLATTLIAYVTLKTFYFYRSRSQYPPGPFPLPLLGNILLARKSGEHFFDMICNLSKKYGPIFTFYFGPQPIIVVNDPDLVKKVCSKVAFAGRIDFDISNTLMFKKGSIDVIFFDYSREWEVLRKVTHSAIRKFVTNVHLPEKVATSCKAVVGEIINREGLDKAFDQNEYFYLMTHSILAKGVYGIDFSFDNEDFIMLKESLKVLQDTAGQFFAAIVIPLLRIWYSYQWKKARKIFATLVNYQCKQMKRHEESFNPNEIRDFCDALLDAKLEAEKEEKADVKYLTIDNLTNVLLDVFLAGTDTTRMTLQWLFLILANEPELQEQIRQEVDSQIGDEMPTLQHKSQCHLINALITETLRFRPIAGMVHHKALKDTTLGGRNISQGSVALVSLFATNLDEKTFPEPRKFKLHRFLQSDGTFNVSASDASLPFGCQGKRACPGNKFALAEVFMLLVGWFQNTRGHTMQLEGGPGSHDYSVDINNSTAYAPKPYRIKLVRT